MNDKRRSVAAFFSRPETELLVRLHRGREMCPRFPVDGFGTDRRVNIALLKRAGLSRAGPRLHYRAVSHPTRLSNPGQHSRAELVPSWVVQDCQKERSGGKVTEREAVAAVKPSLAKHSSRQAVALAKRNVVPCPLFASEVEKKQEGPTAKPSRIVYYRTHH